LLGSHYGSSQSVSNLYYGYLNLQRILGLGYGEGICLPDNDVIAYMWLNLASSDKVYGQGPKNYRDHLTGRMTKEQIALGQKLSSEWQQKKGKSK
jgi:hypothetical protein